MTRHYDAIIIGGGPAGVTALKTQTEAGVHCILFEAEEQIGGTFRYRAYENSELVSSKQLTAFTDYRFSAAQGDHVSLPEYCAYLERYVEHFGLTDKINLQSRVVKVEKSNQLHSVTVKRNGNKEHEHYTSSHLIICTGLHCIPQIPTIPGIDRFKSLPGKTVIHSSEHKTRDSLTGRKVIILGTGETGMDLAYESIKAGAAEVYLCSRGGFLSFPKVLNNFTVLGRTFDGNLPIDGLITNLFETTYVHPWVAASHLRWFVSDFMIKRVLWLLTGTQAGCNQWAGELPEERLGRAYVFLNKSHKASPYLNRPYKSRSKLLSFLSEYHDPPEDTATPGQVEMAPFPTGIDETGRVEFDWDKCERRGGSWRKVRQRLEKRRIEPDLIIFASGYRQEFSSWLSEEYPRPWDCTVRDIVSRSDPTVAYLGFVRPGVGAIPPIAEQQAMWITALWNLPQSKLAINGLPQDEPSYYLLAKEDARIKYGVDHSTYQSTLANDFGGLPGLGELLRVHGVVVTLIYCFSASFTSHYRLLPSSPFYSDKMVEVEKGEILDTIKRRGVLGNVFMGVIPMIFYGLVNLTALVLEVVWIACGRPDVIGLCNRARSGDHDNMSVNKKKQHKRVLIEEAKKNC
ncbi:flavin-containing monooxygenase [Sporobolomyces koalae]|uniref:flavin-containing monooxygenase n=1 Tax=Sporobolomyces koalae TaxID=500713 RepID=UPI003170B9EB